MSVYVSDPARSISAFLAMKIPSATHNDLEVHRGRGGRATIGKSGKLLDAEAALEARMGPLREQLAEGWGGNPMSGPLELEVGWVYSTPNEWREGAPKITRPDLSNLLKTLEDVLVRCRIVADDSLFCLETLSKEWGPIEGISVRISEISEVDTAETALGQMPLGAVDLGGES